MTPVFLSSIRVVQEVIDGLYALSRALGRLKNAFLYPMTGRAEYDIFIFERDTAKECSKQVDVEPEIGDHSERLAALGSQHHEPSFGYVTRRGPLRTVSEAERQTPRSDAHSSI